MICAAVDAAAGYVLSARSGEIQASVLWSNAGFGAVLGILTAIALGVLVIRFHSIGYIFGLTILIGMLVMAAYLATATDYLVLAASLGVAVPLYLIALVITFIMVRPRHPDREARRL